MKSNPRTKQILSGAFFNVDNSRGTFTEHRGKSTTYISRTAYSFDIETTLNRQTECTFMYVGQLAVNDTCYIFRTWDNILNAIEQIYNDGNENNHSNIIWIANLGYEMSFMLPRIARQFQDKASLEVFADTPRHPLFVRLVNTSGTSCVEFRDTLRVSGLDLRETAMNYCKTQKLEMEYSTMRNSKTDISDIIEYCANDVFICNEYYDYLLESLVDNGEYLPYTQTGIVRNKVKADYKNSEFYENHAIKSMFPKTLYEYNRVMNWLYSGGITHANHDFVGDIVENVTCIDFTSSYPAVMVHEKYPMGSFTRTKLNKFEQLKRNPFWYCTVTLNNVKQTTSHSLISTSKCIKAENVIEDNGRVMYADSITIMITNIDYEYLSKFYTWDKNYRITSAYICKNGDYLPEYVTKNMLHNGQLKAELKEQGLKDTPEYFKNKAMFNCYYGLCVQRLVRDSITWSLQSGYITEPADDYYKIKSQAVLSPYWGVYVASYARRNLCINMWNIEKTGADVVYYDTDSLYVHNIDKAVDAISDWNKSMYKMNQHLKLNKCFSDLGAWDKDPVVTFKTLGAKRYIKMTSDGHIKATIAGLPKKAFPYHDVSAFEHFTEGMEISAAVSMKLTAKYIDNPYENEISDSDGNTETMFEYSGTSLIKIPFSLTIAPMFKQLMIKLHKHF